MKVPVCEQCLSPVDPDAGCPTHPFADVLDPENADDAALIATRVELSRPRRQAAWIAAYAVLTWLVSLGAAAPLVTGWAWLAGGEAPTGIVLQGATLLWILVMAVSSLLWSGKQVVEAKRRQRREAAAGEAEEGEAEEGEAEEEAGVEVPAGEDTAREDTAGEDTAGEDTAREDTAREATDPEEDPAERARRAAAAQGARTR